MYKLFIRPTGHIKLAHQFWFSYAPPGAGGSSNSKSAQTDEEKQRERQRNEREIKQAEIEAHNIKKERDAREARQLDREIRAQERHYQAESKKQKEAAELLHKHNQDKIQSHQIHTQLSQTQKGTTTTTTSSNRTSSASTPPSKSPRDSIERNIISSSSATDGETPKSRPSSIDKEHLLLLSPSSNQSTSDNLKQDSIVHSIKDSTSTTPSPQTLTCPPNSHHSVVTSGPPIPFTVTALATVAPILPLGVTTLRDDSTESDQSLNYSQSQSEALHQLMCRAPIASLDCMEEFSGTGGQLDFGRSISLGSNPALPIRQSTTPTPGLRYKNLGKSGLRVSNVGLGTWPVFSPGVPEDQAEAIIKLAIESGINIFDISEPHSEIELGKILQKHSWKRSTYIVTTKIYWNVKSDERGLSRKHIIESVKASLQRLQLPYIDIVIIYKADSMCPMEEVVRAMTYVIQQGWAMYWGTSRWSQVEIMEAYTNCRQFNCITPIVEQAEYHMFCREKCELYLPEMFNKIGVGLMVWGPLSMAIGETQNGGERILFPKGSFKTKSHSYSWTEDEINKNGFGWTKEKLEDSRRQSDRIRDLSTIAEKLGCSPTQLSIAWSLKHEPVQCLLLGATTAEQLHQSLQALQLLPRLSTSVMLELERILENKPVRPPAISTLALR